MSDESEPNNSISLEKVVSVPVGRLALDHRNPRLITAGGDTSDEEIIAQLYRAEDLGELLQSIAANGYLDIEPLIVLEDQGRLVVLEGNRRLAAIRLFREPELATRIKQRKQLRITLPEMPETHRATLNKVSVYRVANREDARSFIGFKHINGAAKWNSYAKAKFAADWYQDGKIPLADIASSIGDKHDTVKRMINAIYVLQQAQSENIFHMDDRASPRFNFSHLYTALSRASYMRFLGLDIAWSGFGPRPAPVPEDKITRLSEILRWIYGSKENYIEPVVQSQNPDIKRLGEVLESAEGLAVLRATGSLADAHASTQSADRKFSEALLRARHEIREVSNSLRGFDGREKSLIDIAADICETAQTVHDRMKKKAREAASDNE